MTYYTLSSSSELTIRQLQDGGFLVMAHNGGGYMASFLFASTTIEEALRYIKRHLIKEAPTP